MNDTIVGIDLGSYYARIAAVIDETVSVIKINDERKLECIFSNRNGIQSTGDRAMKTAPNNVIFDACRLQRERRYSETWCYAKLDNGIYTFNDTKNASNKIILQTDAIAAILGTLKNAAEKRLQKNIYQAVITVPDSIDQYHRLLIIKAAEKAQINVIHLITQNAAAAITFLLNKSNFAPSPFMIFSFGASQLNISIYNRREKTAELIDASYNECLGGEAFTNRLAENILCFVKDSQGSDYIPNGKVLKNIRETAEKIIIDLSMMRETKRPVEVDDEQDHTINFTQKDIEKLCADFYQQIEKIIQKISKKFPDISDIVMIGGSSRIHGVKEIVERYFCKSKFDTILVREEATVLGAAIKGAILGNFFSIEINVDNNVAYSIYCQTEFTKIDVINVNEKLPSTFRRFSFHQKTPEIEFFDYKARSLGVIKNVNENETVACFVDNNGLLKCYVNDNKYELKQIALKNEFVYPTTHYGRNLGSNSGITKNEKKIQRNTADIISAQQIGDFSKSEITFPSSFLKHNSNFAPQQKPKKEIQRSFNERNYIQNTAHSNPNTNFDSEYYSFNKPQQTLNYQQRNQNKNNESVYKRSKESRNPIKKFFGNNRTKDYDQPSEDSPSNVEDINRPNKNTELKQDKFYKY
uniref:DnaK protein n=1 Tax=Panagrolaimus sp. PS1159 TaxID=55785 RepID=A0AC35G5V5_9BILA